MPGSKLILNYVKFRHISVQLAKKFNIRNFGLSPFIEQIIKKNQKNMQVQIMQKQKKKTMPVKEIPMGSGAIELPPVGLFSTTETASGRLILKGLSSTDTFALKNRKIKLKFPILRYYPVILP